MQDIQHVGQVVVNHSLDVSNIVVEYVSNPFQFVTQPELFPFIKGLEIHFNNRGRFFVISRHYLHSLLRQIQGQLLATDSHPRFPRHHLFDGGFP